MARYADAVETHTGAVLFVGELAYKVKKPVDLGFVDWRSPVDRKAACEREVALNRRLAPDVYLGVGELRAPDGAAEPAVVMRRLPADRRLSTLVAAGVDVTGDLRRLTHQLAAFHLAAPTTALAAAQAGAAATLDRWERNHDRMVGVDVDLAGEVLAAARRYLAGRGPLFASRVAGGWARDGHGDLLADDVFCLDDGPRALDCLDFDDRLRVGDVLADVAFLAMDLDRLGRADLGALVLALHRRLTGDTWPASLAHHHVAYRAQVRALVAGIRAHQDHGSGAAEADVCLHLAARHLDAGRIRLVLVGGGPGTGKSTLAAGLGDAVGAVVLRSDEVRKQLAGLAPTQRAGAAPGCGIYGAGWTARTYAALLERAGRLLAMGESVVLDATWLDERRRREAATVAADTASDLVELRCVAPADLVRRRVEQRSASGLDASDADVAVAAALVAGADGADGWPTAVEIPTTGDPAASVAAAVAAFR